MQDTIPLFYHIFHIFKLGGAALCGALLERRLRKAPGQGNGFPGTVLMSVGGCLFMSVAASDLPANVMVLALAVAVGAGAIAAAVILRSPDDQTAAYRGAALWVSALIGTAIGANLFLESGLVTLLAFGVLPATGKGEI